MSTRPRLCTSLSGALCESVPAGAHLGPSVPDCARLSRCLSLATTEVGVRRPPESLNSPSRPGTNCISSLFACVAASLLASLRRFFGTHLFAGLPSCPPTIPPARRKTALAGPGCSAAHCCCRRFCCCCYRCTSAAVAASALDALCPLTLHLFCPQFWAACSPHPLASPTGSAPPPLRAWWAVIGRRSPYGMHLPAEKAAVQSEPPGNARLGTKPLMRAIGDPRRAWLGCAHCCCPRALSAVDEQAMACASLSPEQATHELLSARSGHRHNGPAYLVCIACERARDFRTPDPFIPPPLFPVETSCRETSQPTGAGQLCRI